MSHYTPKIDFSRFRNIWCVAAVMALCLASVSAESASQNQAYYIHVGLVAFKSEAPDDPGGVSEYYVTVGRNNLTLVRQLAKIYRKHTDLVSDEQRISKKMSGTDPENISKLKSLRKLRDSVIDELVLVKYRRNKLLSLRGGRSLTISTRNKRVNFANMKIPVQVYEGDTVTISVFKEGRGFVVDRLMGKEEIILDKDILNKGRLTLNLGWVESIELKLVRVK